VDITKGAAMRSFDDYFSDVFSEAKEVCCGQCKTTTKELYIVDDDIWCKDCLEAWLYECYTDELDSYE